MVKLIKVTNSDKSNSLPVINTGASSDPLNYDGRFSDIKVYKTPKIIINSNLKKNIGKIEKGIKPTNESRNISLSRLTGNGSFELRSLIEDLLIDSEAGMITHKDRCVGVNINGHVNVISRILPSTSMLEIARKTDLTKFITYGMDPEFEVRNKKGDKKYAADYFSDDGYNWFDDVYSDSNDFVHKKEWNGEMGVDAHEDIAELRVKPSNSIDELVSNTRRVILESKKKLGKKEWGLYSGGGKRDATGGHIHINGVKNNEKLLKLFDYFLGIPLNSKDTNSLRGSSSEYGKESDSKYQGGFHWEYRTPPSFLATPHLTFVVFNIVDMVIGNFINAESMEFKSEFSFKGKIGIPKEREFDKIIRNTLDRKTVNDYIEFLNDGELERNIYETWK